MVFSISGWTAVPSVNIVVLVSLVCLRINRCFLYNLFQCPDSTGMLGFHRSTLCPKSRAIHYVQLYLWQKEDVVWGRDVSEHCPDAKSLLRKCAWILCQQQVFVTEDNSYFWWMTVSGLYSFPVRKKNRGKWISHASPKQILSKDKVYRNRIHKFA